MVQGLRAVKDEEEIRLYRIASGITNEIIDLLEDRIRGGKLKTELEVALFIEAEGRNRGCEGMGFETLAAGPRRSFGIHAFPTYTGAPFIGKGFSILDFGMKYEGYTTDVTLTFVREPLVKAQEKTLSLVEQAASLAFSLVKEDADPRAIAQAVDNLFEKSRRVMPHGLGHGIGLEAHELPFLRTHSDPDIALKPGMIFTIEPGLYDPALGGCRLENDILLTEKAYHLALDMTTDGVSARSIALAVDSLFAKARKFMPHGLGHGIGLEEHEAPFLRNRADQDTQLQPGMIITLEPGLYDPVHGGCRLENDILITPGGKEALTRARIIRL
jgi:Xaa-Pro aminopeptidase